ncbi:MAG: ATP-binding protein [Gemmatimonadaceae bacterium]|nr:ATP-binding protein [Gemmatimonadaceae bacterium]
MTSGDLPLTMPLLAGVLDALVGHGVLLDRTGIIVACNRSAATRCRPGVRLDEVLDALAPLAPDDATTARRGIATVLDTTQRAFSLEFPAADGATQRWTLRATALRPESGGGAVVQLAAVSSSEADGAATRTQEASFRSIFIASLDAMVIADAHGHVVSSNPAARRLLGRNEAGVAAMDFAQFFSAGSRTTSPAEAWQLLLQDGQWRGEGRLLVGDSVRVLDVAASAHITPGRHLVTIRDVTEAQQMEAQLRQAQKMEAIGLLTGGMAHDFNNLLTVVLANADLVLESLPDEMDELRDEVGQMIQAATRGSEMVKKLLAFSRRETLERRPVSLEVVLAETQALLARLLPSNITVRTDAAPELPGILADPGAVQHMLINLATNARDAMPTGGVLTMRGGYEQAMERPDGTVGPMVTVTVEDTGRGMDEEVLAHLFEPFFTTKAPGEGTGLGMAMIYGLVQQHDGTIDVQSTPGRGTRVTIGLPLAEVTVPNATPRSSLLVRSGATETILLVEDEEMVRRAGRRILEKHGYRVLQAADGAEALMVLRERGKEIALVVSDVVMPRMGGRELYASLREEGYRMPFLFTSGYTDRMSSDTVALDPSVPVLPKPWTWTELTASVRAALDEGFTPR